MDTDNYTIKFTAHDYKDLENIFEYISKNLYVSHTPQAADHIMNMLDDSINSLSAQPFIAPLISDDFLAAKGLRKLIAENYIVIYKVIKEACEIIIYCIVNDRTDYIIDCFLPVSIRSADRIFLINNFLYTIFTILNLFK